MNVIELNNESIIEDIKEKNVLEKKNTIIEGKIYKVCNLLNGKVYIGQTIIDIALRIRDHFNKLKRNKHNNGHLQNSWNKYNNELFWEWKIIDIPDTIEKLNFLEYFYIKYYGSDNRKYGYNIREGGGNRGRLSKESKLKISIANTGKLGYWKDRKMPMEARRKMSRYQRGKYISNETKEKISIATTGKNNPMYGKTHSPEICKKLSEISKEKCGGINNPMYGKKHSEDTKRKIGIKSMGRKPMLGKNHSQETIDKMKKSWIIRKEKTKSKFL